MVVLTVVSLIYFGSHIFVYQNHGGEFLAEKSTLDWIALVLVIIGGLNWGLFGIPQDLNLVALIFGYSIIARIVYILVGLSALYMVYYATKK